MLKEKSGHMPVALGTIDIDRLPVSPKYLEYSKISDCPFLDC